MKQDNASTTEIMILFDSYSAISVFIRENIHSGKIHWTTTYINWNKRQYTVYMYLSHSQTYRAKHADHTFKKYNSNKLDRHKSLLPFKTFSVF